MEIASKALLIDRYKELIGQPDRIIKLLVKKFYIGWSGNYYSIELIMNYRANENDSSIVFLGYGMLFLSNIIYMLLMIVGVLGINDKNENSDYIYIYKCLLLGVVAVLLISEIMNKYTVHQTLSIFLLVMSNVNIPNSIQGKC